MRVADRAGSLRISRPVLRTIMGILLLFVGFGTAHAALFSGVSSRDRPASDQGGWLLALFVVLAAVYCYVASTLEVSPTAVVIQNPLRRIAIPVGHITSVKTGLNLRVDTAYTHAYAWGVEAANIDLFIGRLTKQESLAETILTRSEGRRDPDATLPAARYRWTLPPLFIVLLAPIFVLTAFAIAADWHPLAW